MRLGRPKLIRNWVFVGHMPASLVTRLESYSRHIGVD
jgi:hypothetical protein